MSHHFCGSILLQRQGSNNADHHRTDFDNENGNGHELYYTAISALPNFLRACVTVKVVWAIRQSGRSCTVFHALPQLISLHVFEDGYSGLGHCIQGKSKVFVWFGFCWARPRFLLLRCFALWRNANLAGGFAGRSWSWFCLVSFVFRDDLPEYLDHTCPIHYCFSPLTLL